MNVTMIVLSSYLFSSGICAMDTDLNVYLSQNNSSEVTVLADWAMKKYHITSSRDVIIDMLKAMPATQRALLLKLPTKKRSSAVNKISEKMVLLLMNSLDNAAKLQQEQADMNRETAQRHLQFAKVATTAEIIASIVAVILSNVLTYYLSH